MLCIANLTFSGETLLNRNHNIGMTTIKWLWGNRQQNNEESEIVMHCSNKVKVCIYATEGRKGMKMNLSNFSGDELKIPKCV